MIGLIQISSIVMPTLERELILPIKVGLLHNKVIYHQIKIDWACINAYDGKWV